MPHRVPDACTLPTAEQPLRQEEFTSLCRTALRGQERLSARHLRLMLAGADDLEATVRDLAGRESECCSFFVFTVTRTADAVLLDIEVPDAQVNVLDGLSELADSASAIGSR
ncbi:MAG: hypothetical protein M3313_11745 [Actinomycetota bacterium]|nr:hypothetical protein [Actinomycetota bacterium]